MIQQKKTIVCDLDGVLLSEEKTFERSMARPLKTEIDLLTKAHKAGHTIIIHTARTWSEYAMTAKQLADYRIPYHVLICGKPVGDIVIDDRAYSSVTEASQRSDLFPL